MIPPDARNAPFRPSVRGPSAPLTRRTLLLLLGTALRQPAAAEQAEREKAEQREGVFSAETNLVALDVSVLDKKRRSVDRLAKEDFRIFENNVEQNIAFFSHENRPACWGMVLDRSGSMAAMMEEVYNAALHSVEAGTHEDESFIIAFDGSVEIVQDFTADRRKLLRTARSIVPGGSTALYDAVALALDHIQHGRHQKKVLVVVTDGEDNASRFTFGRLLDMVKESESLIYAVGLFESMDLPILNLLRRSTEKELKRLAEESGGLSYFPKNMKECDQACRDIAEQVSRQYSLGYYPSNTDWDGKWRDLRVEVAQPEQRSVRARRGYFGRGLPQQTQ